MAGANPRQAPGRADPARGRKDLRALAGEFIGHRHQAILGRVGRREGKDREATIDDGDRTVQHLGRGVVLGMDPAGFLELQRRLARHGESRAAAEGEERRRLGETLGQPAPVGPPGAVERIGQCPDGSEKRRVPGPFGDEQQRGDGRGHESLRRRDAELGPCGKADDALHRLRKGRCRVIGQRDRHCTPCPRRPRHLHDVRAPPRLRDDEAEPARKPQRRAVDRGDRRADRGDRQAEHDLADVFQVGRGMVRRAPRHGRDEGRVERPAPAAAAAIAGPLRSRSRATASGISRISRSIWLSAAVIQFSGIRSSATKS